MFAIFSSAVVGVMLTIDHYYLLIVRTLLVYVILAKLRAMITSLSKLDKGIVVT